MRRSLLPLFFLPLLAAAQPAPFSVDEMQRRTFLYFWELADTVHWQIPDRYPTLTFSSIAATGFGLSAYLVGVERDYITRGQAAERVLKTLESLKNLPQGPEAKGMSGYKGFFYHFLDLKNARRFKEVELSTIDTAWLIAGILSAMSYFDGDNPQEKAIRDIADFLYRRVEWDWIADKDGLISMGWYPEKGFHTHYWKGMNEAMFIYFLALGSPTHPVAPTAWQKWCETYEWTQFHGQEMIQFGPLFGHQYSHMYVDFRGIQDDYTRDKGIDYFENARRATLAQRAYCIANPHGFEGYGENLWGLTACDGPGWAEKMYKGKKTVFHGYAARGAATVDYLDDGTIAPTAAGGSAPFAPEVCLPALHAMWTQFPHFIGRYGPYDAFNLSFSEEGWFNPDWLGIDQGPILLQLENHRTGLIWNLMKKNPYVVEGLRKAGFQGGWLDGAPQSPAALFEKNAWLDAEGNMLPYRLLRPENPADGEKYPLVIFLHGSGERGDDNEAQLRNGVLAFAEPANREQYPCFVLAPQCPKNEHWSALDPRLGDRFSDTPTLTMKLLLELIDQTLADNPAIDAGRIYVTGLSRGGIGTFDLLCRRPGLAAAAMPLCGGYDPAAAAQFARVPMRIVHGELDEVIPPVHSQDMYQAILEAGGSPELTLYSTLGHAVWQETYYNSEVLAWLFAQRKE
jgi:predicted esterase